jgi:hypothetical protein
MSDENQAPPPPDGRAPRPGGPPAPHPAFEFLEPESGTAAAGAPRAPGTFEPPAPWAPTPPAPLPRSVLHGALALALLGLASLLLGQVEAALLIAVAALYFTAQAADVHPAMGRVYTLLAWIPPATGALALGALAGVLVTNGPLTPLRAACAVVSGIGALASLASLMPAAGDRLVGFLFRGAGSSHTLRLTANIVLVIAWVAFPTWLVFRDQLARLLQDPGSLVSASKLSGGLVGYVVLAFASVGFMVRRDARGSLERLGLTALRPTDALMVVAGVAALWLVNVGSEALERSALPALWTGDQAFTSALAGAMGPGQMLLLGLSAGIGEELTLRGALQPKLGIALTSLLFAALHVQYSWYGMLAILGLGLILGAIRRSSGTTAAILAHALYDLLAVLAARP